MRRERAYERTKEKNTETGYKKITTEPDERNEKVRNKWERETERRRAGELGKRNEMKENRKKRLRGTRNL